MGPSSNQSPIIVGCGYLGHTLGQFLVDQLQLTPLCIVKSKQSYSELLNKQADVIMLDLDQTIGASLNCANCDIYYLAPPGTIDENDHRIDNFLQHCHASVPRKIVYISTSGVYGDCNGEWVDETRPIAPNTQRAKRRAYAEQSLKLFCEQNGCEYVILRVGGIYGAERLPIQRLQRLKVICPEEAPYSNRIHISDLAKICHSAMGSKLENEIINVADGHPTSMTDYFYQIADLADLPRPECVPMSRSDELSPGMLSFINESRRLSIEKMQSLLNVQLKFPTLTLGLSDCFKQLSNKNL